MALGTSGAGLAQGGVADMVSLAVEDPAMICRKGDALLDSWIFAGPGRAVDCVWAAGRKLVERGRHQRREEISRDYRMAMEQLCA